MSGEYPRAVYHPVFGGKTVTTPEDYAEALRTGWANTPALVREAERLRATIVDLEEKLDAARARLSVLDGQTPQNALVTETARKTSRPRKP